MNKDKRQHIFMGAVAAIVVGFITYLVSGEGGEYNVVAGIYAALSVGFVAAAVKEYCDTNYSFNLPKWDWKDIAATMIGAAIVALFIVGLHLCKG